MAKKNAWKWDKGAKFEHDSLKTNEDIGQQLVTKFLQMFVWWGASLYPSPYKHL